MYALSLYISKIKSTFIDIYVIMTLIRLGEKTTPLNMLLRDIQYLYFKLKAGKKFRFILNKLFSIV